jgi:hypothetical protein
MSVSRSWIWKSLLISAVVALVTCAGFYLFSRIHQELNFQPAHWWELGAAVFLISAMAAMIYFRMRSER